MIATINSEKIPIKLWLRDIDEETLQQAKNLANLPFVFHHIAVMPDAHLGYGMPIGGIAATEGVIIPNAVGVDIGCGVCAVRTSLPDLQRPTLKQLAGALRQQIPLGFKHHIKPQPVDRMPEIHDSGQRDLPVVRSEFENGRYQLGTLGGGNHFIEIQQGDDGFIWIMIHSGSRNIGYKVAQHYNSQAKSITKTKGWEIPRHYQLDALDLHSRPGCDYFAEMSFCVNFARLNRASMLEVTMNVLADLEPSVSYGEPLDVAHNYAAREMHFGKEVIVHRKGATLAAKGDSGIIPGSQGSHSYIVRGLGNPESFSSCSHGAGRKLGRKQAQRQLDLQKETELLNRLGVLHSIRSRKHLDEAAGAYKDINEVIDNQLDLVQPVTRLSPLAVIKG
jgi:tRNA-splicing ligase RtcB